MRIAILSTIENYEWAGTEEVWYQFALKALEHGHELLIAVHKNVYKSSQVQKLKDKGVSITVRSPFKPTRLYLFKEKLYPEHTNFVKKFNPDILLINSGSLLDVTNLPYLAKMVKSINSKKIFFCHFVADLLIPKDRDKILAMLSTCEKIIFVSEHNKKLAIRQLANKLKNSCVIPNASKFERANRIVYNNNNNNTVRFACVARLETLWKGQDLLIELLSSEKWKKRDWSLSLYGTGNDEIYIKNLIKLYGLEKRIFLKGYVSNVEQIWKDNEVLLLPSRGEGMPLAVIEAMMCGRIVVCTDVGGNREIIEDKLSGFIADSYTSNSFDTALENAWRKKDEWDVIGNRAFVKAKELNNNNPASLLLNTII